MALKLQSFAERVSCVSTSLTIFLLGSHAVVFALGRDEDFVCYLSVTTR